MLYRYETHCHTSPVSRCAHAGVRETVEFYHELGFDGLFITNHFIDANANTDGAVTYEEKIVRYFEAVEEGQKIGREIGIKVFSGVEMTYGGSDFLVYGLDKQWYIDHPEIEGMQKSKELPLLMQNGALVVHAHPFREANYIDHIRLFPRCIQAVETLNISRTEFENKMADIYADNYGFMKTAGSDNHHGKSRNIVAGMETETPLTCEQDYIDQLNLGKIKPFVLNV